LTRVKELLEAKKGGGSPKMVFAAGPTRNFKKKVQQRGFRGSGKNQTGLRGGAKSTTWGRGIDCFKK